jgi:hypothetical protein
LANYQTVNLGSVPTISITGAGGAGSNAGLFSNVTLGQSIGIGAVGAQSSSDDFFTNLSGSHVKKYQVYEIENDLLALSVTWHRLRKNHMNGGQYVPIDKLIDSTLIKHLSGEDMARAQEIHDYYSKKIMVMKLKGSGLSRYKEDLNTFVHSNGKIFKEDMCPLAYRLPEFYEYDVELDTLFGKYNRTVRLASEPERTLKLVKSLYVGKKYSKRKEYWFSDEYDNLHKLTFTHDNPLLTLLDYYAQNEIKIAGKWRRTSKDDREYFINDKPIFG